MCISKHCLLGLAICLSLILCSCATQVAMDAWGLKLAVGTTLADIRISEKLATVDGDGVQISSDKDAMSRELAETLQIVLPELVEAAVKAAIASAGIGAVGDILGGFGNGELDVPEIMEEVVPDDS